MSLFDGERLKVLSGKIKKDAGTPLILNSRLKSVPPLFEDTAWCCTLFLLHQLLKALSLSPVLILTVTTKRPLDEY